MLSILGSSGRDRSVRGVGKTDLTIGVALSVGDMRVRSSILPGESPAAFL